MKLYVSTGNSRMDKIWNGQEMELEDFIARISVTKRTSETVTQYKKMSKAKQDAIKDVGGFVMGRLKDGRRKRRMSCPGQRLPWIWIMRLRILRSSWRCSSLSNVICIPPIKAHQRSQGSV